MSEDILQAKIYQWFHNTYCSADNNPRYEIFAVPNGAYVSKREAAKLKSTGLKAGVSDLVVLMPNRCIFVEVKTETGKQSDKQKVFEATVKGLGFEYYVVRSVDDMLKIVNVVSDMK